MWTNRLWQVRSGYSVVEGIRGRWRWRWWWIRKKPLYIKRQTKAFSRITQIKTEPISTIPTWSSATCAGDAEICLNLVATQIVPTKINTRKSAKTAQGNGGVWQYPAPTMALKKLRSSNAPGSRSSSSKHSLKPKLCTYCPSLDARE